ncbi:DnaB-like helicase C-terminal domain-containing protein [Lacipirellula limnantheis]|uniref:Replicative DNA helicase n=1 Tax=Lacipirellula limnantheis TaxID=2528024 RepID=A0A517TV18_9BACT|nr:DnaB-like helicase C-terminal domain-containing protein [Lacipirellula limnantheis]QDT72223.1 Replicative DNA helicase [Lacipirellula limnantheis]
MNHLKTLPLIAERKFDGGDRWKVGGDEPPPSPDGMEQFEKWAMDFLNRRRPATFRWAPAGSRLETFKVGAEAVVLVGAPPATGKTAWAGQVYLDCMRVNEDMRVLVANVEMSTGSLLDRHLARLSGVGYGYIQERNYSESAKPRLMAAIEELRELKPRLEFLTPPFTIEHLAERAVNFGADLVVVDYCQRFDHEKRSSDQRAQANRVMEALRRLADDERGVLAISAVNRGGYGKDATIAAFRESSELEYGADSAWLLIRDGDSPSVTLRCVKNRHGRIGDVQLLFDGSRQQFDADPAELEWIPQ